MRKVLMIVGGFFLREGSGQYQEPVLPRYTR
jgi:hypothetical protein